MVNWFTATKEGEPKPELMDDWDQRLVVTLMEVNDEGTKLTLKQVAEKDQVRFFIKVQVLNIDIEFCSGLPKIA